MKEPYSSDQGDVKPLVVLAGPCSAESLPQLLATAEGVKGLPITYFRAGLWKPRTRPGTFEGVGKEGLAWLREVKDRIGLPVMTEVSLPWQVDLALKNGIDALWIGARSVSDPFAVQELAEALRGINIPLYVKNPISPDIELWIGAIERLLSCGQSEIHAIFRGISPSYGSKLGYRNSPSWSFAFELRRLMPTLPIICDPSHISGRRQDVGSLCRKSIELGFDGIMVETHINPSEAKSDASQQVTPKELGEILEQMQGARRTGKVSFDELDTYRKLLYEIDENLLSILAHRMEIAREIGKYKQKANIPILQMEHFSRVLKENCQRARRFHLPENFIYQLFTEIHELSTKFQLEETDENSRSTPDLDSSQSADHITKKRPLQIPCDEQ